MVRVVDDLGMAVSGAQVRAGWTLWRDPVTGAQCERGVGVSGTTDKNGLVSLGVQDIPSIVVVMKGYYQNGIDGSRFMRKYFTNPDFSANKVKVQIVISRIIHPVPMYVRSVCVEIPSLDGAAAGFDLEIGDWVAPKGKGVISDFVVHVNHKVTEPNDWDQEGVISFSSLDDGIMLVSIPKLGSRNKLRLPASAPVSGYMKSLKWSCFSHRGRNRLEKLYADPAYIPGTLRLDDETWNDDDNYIFRIRSKIDADGSIKAWYGKIHGPIAIIEQGQKLKFRYYLNPDGTPELEWDVNNNLAGAHDLPLEP